MPEYIERDALVHHFMNTKHYLTKDLVMDAAYEISKFPAADVVEVRPELRKTVELLRNEYEKAKQLDFVYDPLSYAVYLVWETVDRRRKNGR